MYQDNPSPYLLVASDMDGTLLNSQHQITPFTKRVLFRVEHERHVPFIFATGRHHLSVRAARDDLVQYFAEQTELAKAGGMRANAGGVPGFYIVSSNGARVHDDKGKLVLQHNLDPDIVRALYEEFGLPYTHKNYAGPPGTVTPPLPNSPVMRNAEGDFVRVDAATGAVLENAAATEEFTDVDADEQPEEVVSTSAYTTDQWFITTSFLPEAEMAKKFGFVPKAVPFDVHDPKNKGKSTFDDFPVKGVGKVCFRSSNRDILTYFERAVKERFGARVSVALSSNFCLDVMAAGISKATALSALAERLTLANPSRPPITMDTVVSFGDSLNDKQLLSDVGKGCLMQNAQARLKAELPNLEIIGNHNDDAVAKKLLEIFQLPAE